MELKKSNSLKIQHFAWSILVLALLGSCSDYKDFLTGKDDANDAASETAPTLSYSGSPYTWEKDDAVAIAPTLGGGAPTSCTSSPDLPAGLSINATTCEITGTPTANQSSTSYTITANNAGGDGTATLSIEIVADSTAPAVSSSTPDDAATAVAPNSGVITVVFDDQMNTSLTPTLTTEAWNGSAYVAIPNTGTTFTWSTDGKTLTVNISWVQFPESAQLRWTLAAANLQDKSGNVIAGDIQRTFTTNSRNTYFAIADTGQTLCYNGSTSITCGDASFPGQDGDYADTPNARSFSGPTPHATYTSDSTTTDNVTGLVWKSCSEGLSGATCATGSASTSTWYNAINQCAALNTANSGAGYAGRTDWRLPTRMELRSIANNGVNNPAIDATYFPATVAGRYWSASTYVGLTTTAWSVGFNSGYSSTNFKTDSYSVRCVAPGP